jgi:PilZ domain-containing protein
MRTDRRKSHRRAVSIPARLEITIGSPPLDCLITDLSDGGVRLYIETVEIPDRFVLWFSADGRNARPRDCSVVWRLGHEIGAKFTDARGRGHKASSTAKVDEPAAV